MKPPQYGIEDYFRSIGRVTKLPKILYNIPGRTGGKGAMESTIRALRDDDVIIGVKDATGDTDVAERLKYFYGQDITIYSGDDGKNLDFARIGASGTISVASHWAGREIGMMLDAEAYGNVELANRINKALDWSSKIESFHDDEYHIWHDTPNPIPTKVMMARILGLSSLELTRSPMIASPLEMGYLRVATSRVYGDLQTDMKKMLTRRFRVY